MAANNSYVRPHSEIYQFLDRTLSSTGNHISACVVGAQYDLYRYGREVTEGVAPAFTNSSTQDIPLDFKVDPLNEYIVDSDNVSVYGEGLYLKMPYDAGTGDVSNVVVIPDSASNNLYKVYFHRYNSASTGASVIVAGANLAADFGGCSVKVGDTLLIHVDTEDSVHPYSYITATVKSLVESEDAAGSYDAAVLDVPVFDSDTAAVFELVAVLRKHSGAVAVSTTGVSYDASTKKWKVTISENLALPGGKDDGTAATVTILDNGDIYGIDRYGMLYPSYRVLVTPPMDDEVLELRGLTEIQDKLGTVSVANEIAYAANEARRGAAGRPVYAVRVRHTGPGVDLTPEDFIEAMRKTDSNDYTYVFVPVVDGTGKYDREIIRAVADFNNDKSQPEVQMWRQSYFGIDLAGSVELKFISSGTPGPVSLVLTEDVARITAAPAGTSFRRVNFSGADDTLRSGDTIHCANGDVYTVKNVLSDTMVQLTSFVTGSNTTSTSISKMERPESTGSKGLAATSLADALSDRRCKVVWTDTGTYNGEVISNAYIAAFIAGLRSAVQPQKSLTNSEVAAISACPAMYTRYTIADLDNIAKHGVTIVTQDTKYDAPHIRHDLTTDMVNGLLYSESSVTTNVDNISYAVKDVIRPFYGRANVTASALRELRTRVNEVLTRFTGDSIDDLVGPSLVKFENLTVTQDPDMKDRVVVRVDYYVPSPMNVVQVFQMVYLADITVAQAA